MQLTKTFPAEVYASALESWSWLGLGRKVPVQASLFGDVFFQDTDGYWFLDSLEGKLEKVASTKDELQAVLNTEEGQDRYLLGGLATAAEQRGIRLQPSEVYNFTIRPILGGKTEVENVRAMPFVVALDIAGQIHDQVRHLPPGTKISGLKIQK